MDVATFRMEEYFMRNLNTKCLFLIPNFVLNSVGSKRKMETLRVERWRVATTSLGMRITLAGRLLQMASIQGEYIQVASTVMFLLSLKSGRHPVMRELSFPHFGALELTNHA